MTSAFEQIICGVDLNDPIPPAIEFAHRVAAATGARLDLVGRFEPSSAEQPPEYLAEVHAAAVADLDDLDVDEHDGVTATHQTAVGSLVDALAEKANSDQPGLVVVGAHRVDGVTPMALGGLAHDLAHRVKVPVAEVHDLRGRLRGGTFIVGIDGSDASRAALDWARSLARATGSHCCAVFAADPMYGTFQTHGWYGKDGDAAEGTAAADDDVEFVERLDEEPTAALLSEAEKRNAGLIVVAARERHTFGGHPLGKVPDHLMHHPKWPVIVIPHAYLAATVAASA